MRVQGLANARWVSKRGTLPTGQGQGWWVPLVGASNDPPTNLAADERGPACADMLEQPARRVST